MSRRGIHPLLMGMDKPKQRNEESHLNPPRRDSDQSSGLESAQRKRYLRSESEQSNEGRSN